MNFFFFFFVQVLNFTFFYVFYFKFPVVNDILADYVPMFSCLMDQMVGDVIMSTFNILCDTILLEIIAKILINTYLLMLALSHIGHQCI